MSGSPISLTYPPLCCCVAAALVRYAMLTDPRPPGHWPGVSENRTIARAAGLVSGLTLCSRIAGLLRDAIVGYYFGAGVAADAFFVAFRVPNLLRRFVAEGAMSVAFVPVFTHYFTTRTRGEAIGAARALSTTVAVFLAVVTLLGWIFAPYWVAVLAPGFHGAKLQLTVGLARWLAPYTFIVGAVALLGGILHSLRHFFAPAFSPFLLNLAMIAAALALCPVLPQPIYGLAYGVLAGGTLQVVLQLAPLLHKGVTLRPVWRPRHAAVRRVFALMTPTVFGAAVYQINIMFGTVLASLLPGGSVSYLWYADRVFEFPVGLVAVALGTAALPSLAEQAARGAHDELRRSLAFTARLTSFLAVPAAAGLLLLARPITVVLFERGAFGAEQTAMTAMALRAFAVGLWSVSLSRIVVSGFYALGDTRTPVRAATVALVVNGVCSLMCMGPIQVDAPSRAVALLARAAEVLAVLHLRHAGLALATSVSATVNLVLLWRALSRRLGGTGFGSLSASLARSVVAAVAMAPPVLFTASLVSWSGRESTSVQAGVLMMAVAAGVAVYGAVSYALGGREVQGMIAVLRRRIDGRGAG